MNRGKDLFLGVKAMTNHPPSAPSVVKKDYKRLNIKALPPLPAKVDILTTLVLRHIHTGLTSKESVRLGDRFWILRSPHQWRYHFPFLSERSLCHAIEKLVALGIVISYPSRHGKSHYITLSYNRLQEISSLPEKKLSPGDHDHD